MQKYNGQQLLNIKQLSVAIAYSWGNLNQKFLAVKNQYSVCKNICFRSTIHFIQLPILSNYRYFILDNVTIFTSKASDGQPEVTKQQQFLHEQAAAASTAQRDLWLFRIIEPWHFLDWKKPLRSPSPTTNPALASLPLNPVPKCHINMSFKYVQD